MKDGFIKTAAGTPEIRVADCVHNAAVSVALMREADALGVRLLVLPELGLTGYTCGDLFLQPALQNGARAALDTLTEASRSLDLITVCGLPLRQRGKLYNCAAVIYRGRVLGIIPKTHLPNYGEFYERRWFLTAPEGPCIPAEGFADSVPFGSHLIFRCDELPEFSFAAEICEDLWAPDPPSLFLAAAGALIIANLSASDETAGKSAFRRDLVSMQSARLVCGYVYANAGEGESTTDLVFAGHNLIAESGTVLAESKRFETGLTVSELDVFLLAAERRRMTTYPEALDLDYTTVRFSMPLTETVLTRNFSASPYLPVKNEAREEALEDLLLIQAHGLKKRLSHSCAKTMVIGVSGGLDSALALLVAVRTCKLLSLSLTAIVAVVMPCFGTTARTKGNAELLCEELGVTLRLIDIQAAVDQHFADIGLSPDARDVTFENAQARERTQVLMDIANQTNGLVIGTGDLSELALGWATYSGDHMSMYGVNASVPKTVVRLLVEYEAKRMQSETLRTVLLDILDTPVSPELLPPKAGEIQQKTEDLVGPYVLHDFFLFHLVRYAVSPRKVLRLAVAVFGEAYSQETILHWLKTFLRRFFAQQFKRSCMPDGPKAGPVSLSPRGDWRMPSDACAALWLAELENL